MGRWPRSQKYQKREKDIIKDVFTKSAQDEKCFDTIFSNELLYNQILLGMS